jgi:DNA-binding winged helix-turn-helix (wHTH) protein
VGDDLDVHHVTHGGEQRWALCRPPASNLRVPSPTRRVTFAPFTLDLETRQLLRGSGLESVHLSPKAYELLCVLVGTRPRAVAKGELHQQLWPSTFVSEATLASLVAELREALGEHGRDARFIRTVHGFGYAFSGKTDVAGTPVESTRHWIICNGRETPLAEGEYLIGRDPDVAIALSSPSVSRQHAKLIVTADVTTVEDLGSKNGTYLRGRAVTSPAALTDGDRIRVGVFELTFRTATGMGSTETQP